MKFQPYPEYKPSSVDWLGEIPEHWDVKKVKRLGVIRYGLGEPPEYVDDGLPFIRATDIKRGKIDLGDVRKVKREDVPWSRRPLLNLHEILVVRSGAYTGDSAIVTEGIVGCIAGYDMILTVEKAHAPFVAWVLLSKYMLLGQIYLERLRAAQPHLNAEELGSFIALVPLFTEQCNIATFLDHETERIDMLIEKKQRQIELLQEKRTALISHAVTKGLDPKAKMKDSGIEWLGEIPEHWESIPLKFALPPCGDAVKTGPFGSQLLSSEMASGTIKVYNQRNVLDCDFSSGENYISESKYIELKSFRIFPGDVLVTTRGTIGRCALFPISAELGILHPCLMRIQANSAIVLPEYLRMLIQDGGIVLLQLKLMSNATTIDVIYSESLKSVRLPLPPVQEQEEILSYIENVVEKEMRLLAKVEKSVDTLREYRTALISAAVTGKIDVRQEAA